MSPSMKAPQCPRALPSHAGMAGPRFAFLGLNVLLTTILLLLFYHFRLPKYQSFGYLAEQKYGDAEISANFLQLLYMKVTRDAVRAQDMALEGSARRIKRRGSGRSVGSGELEASPRQTSPEGSEQHVSHLLESQKRAYEVRSLESYAFHPPSRTQDDLPGWTRPHLTCLAREQSLRS